MDPSLGIRTEAAAVDSRARLLRQMNGPGGRNPALRNPLRVSPLRERAILTLNGAFGEPARGLLSIRTKRRSATEGVWTSLVPAALCVSNPCGCAWSASWPRESTRDRTKPGRRSCSSHVFLFNLTSRGRSRRPGDVRSAGMHRKPACHYARAGLVCAFGRACRSTEARWTRTHSRAGD